ncbi:MAG: hypothetical protein P8Y94_17185, partial [Acidobacteriota bacterium]
MLGYGDELFFPGQDQLDGFAVYFPGQCGHHRFQADMSFTAVATPEGRHNHPYVFERNTEQLGQHPLNQAGRLRGAPYRQFSICPLGGGDMWFQGGLL